MVKLKQRELVQRAGAPLDQMGEFPMLPQTLRQLRTGILATSKTVAQFLSLLLLVGPVLTSMAHAVDQSATQPSSSQSTPSHRKARKKKLEPLVLPPLPAGPLRQVPLDQLPAAAPRITYENGMLAIAAQNATLGEILRNVHQLTGATIDLPPSGANERVVVQLGPGAPRDVLAALLNGTSFNYVMMGSASDPRSVATVTLSSRPGGPAEVQTAANSAPDSEAATPFQPMRQQPMVPMRPAFRPVPGMAQTPPPQPVVADDDSDDSSDADDKDDDSDQPTPQGQPAQPGAVQPQPQGDNQDQNQPNAGPKTPEQILQMIRDGQRPTPPGMPPNQQQQPPQD